MTVEPNAIREAKLARAVALQDELAALQAEVGVVDELDALAPAGDPDDDLDEEREEYGPNPATPIRDELEALESFLFGDTLELTLRGRTYVVPPPDAKTGLLCQRMMSVTADALSGRKTAPKASTQLDDGEELDLYERLLGPVTWAQVMDPANGLNWPAVQHMGTTALIWAAFDKESALEFWKSGGRPKAAPAPAVKVPQDRKSPRTTAKRTQKRASGTSSRPAKKAASAPAK